MNFFDAIDSIEPKPSEITPKPVFVNRRQFISVAAAGASALLPALGLAENCPRYSIPDFSQDITEKKSATRYNNYYEFSTEKTVIHILAKELVTSPWKLSLYGELEKPLELDVEKLTAFCEVERTYRFRCVEGWSMVVPWRGVMLRDLIKFAKPLSGAKYLRFIGCNRPSEMIGQRRPVLDWPYVEGLRMDEALHPLTMVATGMYGEKLPPQNGAPLRLIVPWKYGYKSIKAFQAIEFTRNQPLTSWVQSMPREYDFLANVNPDVPHPRWSQRREVPLGQSRKQRTLMYNGYADLVASLYV